MKRSSRFFLTGTLMFLAMITFFALMALKKDQFPSYEAESKEECEAIQVPEGECTPWWENGICRKMFYEDGRCVSRGTALPLLFLILGLLSLLTWPFLFGKAARLRRRGQ